jgi:hypothetical protein
MTALARRCNPDARQESWLIHYGDVQVGTIGLRSGNPFGTDQWQWRCSFHPGSEPGNCTSGTAAAIFDQAREKLVEIANAIEPAQDGAFTSSSSTAVFSRAAARRTSSAPVSHAPSS